ncbi:MAG: YigZ family protein [Firmicutes bacterium]|nr:YigZ family protein [Bacillota bacterium]
MLKEYLTVARVSEITEIEKKSKFIAQVKPVSSVMEAEEFIAEICKKHWNATHNVYAYYIMENQVEQQKCSDDGEPSGTSGLPTLEAIKALDLINVVVVVTRYFGGVLLGRGGLIRAYGSAARSGLLNAGIIRCVPYQRVKIVVDYSLMGKIQNELLNAGAKIHDTLYFTEVTFIADIIPDCLSQVYQLLQELTADQFEWELETQVYHQEQVE